MYNDTKDIFEKLHSIALKAPTTSGVYLWKNEDGVIIYVGKAKSLKARLASYFNSGKDIKTRLLLSQAFSLEYIQTKNEYEALLLENTFIKKHSPKYNISLKDGKTYPMLKLTKEAFPRLYRTRTIYNDGSLYFGPFSNVNNVDVFLDMVKKTYKLHQCKHIRKRSSPCLYYHIGHCYAPCCGKISEEDYNKQVKEITSILSGNTKTILKNLESEMKKAVLEENFEEATVLRNNMEAINAVAEKNIVQDLDLAARDYVAWASAGEMVSFAVLRMREGKLIERDLYRVQTLKNDSEAMLEFFMSYYVDAKNVPQMIFILAARDAKLAQAWFNKELGVKSKVFTSSITAEEVGFDSTKNTIKLNDSFEFFQYKKTNNTMITNEDISEYGCDDFVSFLIEKHFNKKETQHHYAALEMARFNAKEDIISRLRQSGDFPALKELKSILKMESLPCTIEGFDIAHLQGHFTVAGMVSFKNGKPDKKNYRIFRLKNTDGIIDDYKSMREVVARRYTKLINEKLDLPDLILIDGGIGQVNAAWKILQALEVEVPLIGLAEKNEEIYFPKNSKPFILPRRSDALRLLQRVRDEVHRFSNMHVSKLNIKEKTTSVFEKLPHIGKKRAEKLLKKFGSLKDLKNASSEDIRNILNLSEEAVNEIKTFIENL